MLSSLQFRLWLTYALVVGVITCVVGSSLVLYLIRSPAPVRQEVQRLRLIANLVTRIESRRPEVSDDLQQWSEQLEKAINARVVVFSSQGDILADSRPSLSTTLPAYARLVAKQDQAYPVFRDSQSSRWVYAIQSIGSYRVMIADVRPRLPVMQILEDEFWVSFLRAVMIALVVALGMAYWITRWIGNPVQRIAEAAHQIAQSDSVAEYQPIQPEGPVEVQDLARAVNAMVNRVQTSQQSQRDFVANVSHDLKTPLTSIQGFSQAMLDGTLTSPEEFRNAAGVVFDEAERMGHQIGQLLDLTRLETQLVSLNISSLNLNGLLSTIIEKYSPLAAQSGVQLLLNTVHCPDHVSIIGDAERLLQVFTNLVDNSLKFTPPGGQVLVLSRQKSHQVQVIVADNGLGIPVTELDRIFERFYQADKSRQDRKRLGVGLGLAIARQIVQSHRGNIVAYNVSEQVLAEMNLIDFETILVRDKHLQGSLFVVTLPIGPAG